MHSHAVSRRTPLSAALSAADSTGWDDAMRTSPYSGPKPEPSFLIITHFDRLWCLSILFRLAVGSRESCYARVNVTHVILILCIFWVSLFYSSVNSSGQPVIRKASILMPSSATGGDSIDSWGNYHQTTVLYKAWEKEREDFSKFKIYFTIMSISKLHQMSHLVFYLQIAVFLRLTVTGQRLHTRPSLWGWATEQFVVALGVHELKPRSRHSCQTIT